MVSQEWPIPLIDSERCTGCGECERLCPTRAVEVRGKLAVIVRPADCVFCEICESYCPSGAIGRPFKVVFGANAKPKAMRRIQ